jgi:hypothetical protein
VGQIGLKVTILPVRILQIILLAAWVLVMPLILVAGLYTLSWSVLSLVRFILLIGRKHRHSDWERLNKMKLDQYRTV